VSEQEKSVKENAGKVTDNRKVIVEKVVAKALENGDKLTSNRITILQLMAKIIILPRWNLLL
jgi:toxin-antitoxin system, toxin component, fic family